MKNKQVGIILMSVAMLIGFIVYSFNKALKDIVNTSCSHGSECAMWGTIELQTNISTGLIIFILSMSIYFFFSEKFEKKSENNYSHLLKKLNGKILM